MDPDTHHPLSDLAATTPVRTLLIDDDRKLCELIRAYLAPMGYAVESVHTGPEGLQRAVDEPFDVIVLDVMLPGMDGFAVLQNLRRRTDVPVLMLTARGEEADRIVGLEIGADDYLPKTASPRELLARLRAIIRRTQRGVAENAPEPDLVVGDVRLSPSTRVALKGDHVLDLTPVEFDLLTALIRSSGRVKTRAQLLESIRDRNYEVFDRSIDVHISALRRKLGDDPKQPRYIRTMRSAGYMFIRNPA
jgi:two-component system response regulator CpxR